MRHIKSFLISFMFILIIHSSFGQEKSEIIKYKNQVNSPR